MSCVWWQSVAITDAKQDNSEVWKCVQHQVLQVFCGAVGPVKG